VPVRDGREMPRSAERGQALIEVALVLPVLLILAFGVVGVGKVIEAKMGVSAVAREAARAAALANDGDEAWTRGMLRGQDVAAGYGLSNGSLELTVAPGSFKRGGAVQAGTRYAVDLASLPLMGWFRITVSSAHQEQIDPYRSRWTASGG